MVAADLMMLYLPSLPTFVGIVVTILAIWSAARFTSWYPKRELVRHAGHREGLEQLSSCAGGVPNVE